MCNIARGTSVYGKNMRSMFGCGPGLAQLGYDFSSLISWGRLLVIKSINIS